ncbi:MAG: reverse transcriptase/maturase family protein [Rubripirellula sp.]|nr:reverse transcriptase/maturase family protein [Rubripirellula sp.]
MKRHGNLWPTLTSFEHLLRSSEKAKRGKRFRSAVARYEFNLERELFALQAALRQKTYRPGYYRSFYIYEPKKRQISAAPYRDRIVHHALTGILEPIFEPAFIFDSYACRKGKGTHSAVDRCQHFARQFRYVFKADIRKFFPSMDHDILKEQVARKIKDPDVLWLMGLIIDGSNPQEEVQHYFPGDDLFTPGERKRGIPIGNQTSQFFANVYLDPLDHFVKEQLRFKGHVLLESDRWHLFAHGLSPISPLGDIPQPLSGTALAAGLSVADLFHVGLSVLIISVPIRFLLPELRRSAPRSGLLDLKMSHFSCIWIQRMIEIA